MHNQKGRGSGQNGGGGFMLHGVAYELLKSNFKFELKLNTQYDRVTILVPHV